MDKPYSSHLHSGKDIQTSYEAVRAGFVALALEKLRQEKERHIQWLYISLTSWYKSAILFFLQRNLVP
jgi:hypothetical protein